MRKYVIDPPSGWKYGFPKEYDRKDDESVEEWFVNNGYPQALIDQGMLKYCRSWYHKDVDGEDTENV